MIDSVLDSSIRLFYLRIEGNGIARPCVIHFETLAACRARFEELKGDVTTKGMGVVEGARLIWTYGSFDDISPNFIRSVYASR